MLAISPRGILLVILWIALYACSSVSKSTAPASMTRSERSDDRYAKSRVAEESIGDSAADEETTELPVEQGKPVAPGKRIVLYAGRLVLEVRTLSEKMREIESYAQTLGGFTEQTLLGEQQAQVTVRVPVARFSRALEELSGIGRLLDREVSAADVTREYQDIELRMANDKAVRDRLYVLLQHEKDVNEKVRILREIERLNGAIDAAALRLKLLSERAAYSTIVCELRLLQSNRPIKLPSPFGWIASLKPAERSIFEYKQIRLPTPEKFFSHEKAFRKKEANALFISPRQAQVRAGRVDNEPKADLAFWKTALQKELLFRGFELATESDPSDQSLVFRVTEGLNTRYYAVALLVTDKSIFVIEAWYPDREAHNELHALVAKSISEAKINE